MTDTNGNGRNAVAPASDPPVVWDGIAGFLQRRRRVILRTAALVVALGVAALLVIPTYYKATTVIALKPQPVIQGQTPPYTPEQRLQVEMQAVQARDVLARVVEKQKLDAAPEYNPALRKESGFAEQLAALFDAIARAWQGRFQPSPAEQEELRRAAIVDVVASRTSVVPVRTADLIQVTFSATDPRTAYRVVNEIADTYIAESLRRRGDALQNAADALQSRIEIVKDELRDLPASGGASNTVERQLEAKRTLLQAYITKLGEVLLQKAALEPHAFVQSRAVLPLQKAGIPLYQAIPVLVVAGLLFGVGIGVVQEGLQRTIGDRAQLEALFGRRVLGATAAPARPAIGQLPGRRVKPAAQAVHKACSDVCLELLLARDARRSAVVAFTAPATGEETKLVCIGVARGLADAGHRTLLVEANAPHAAQSAPRGKSGASAMASLASASEAMQAIRKDEASPLAILPTSLDRDSPAADFERAGRAITALADSYEFVLLDLPAIGVGPGARFLAGFADLAVLVLRAGVPRVGVRTALEQLGASGASLLGFVLLHGRVRAAERT